MGQVKFAIFDQRLALETVHDNVAVADECEAVCDLSFKNEGLLKNIASHVYCKNGDFSETVLSRDVTTYL